ncbi:MAG: hypothetical protein PHN75_18975 [Syntrophales bacterium]|nr:hypothetical protein [Syntrophales bacterium]
MNDSRRKMLTEYLGECWHEISSYPIIHNNGIKCVICKKYAKHDPSTRYGIVRRTFTTAQDMVDLAKKMGEKGNFNDFIVWLGLQYRYESDSKSGVWTIAGNASFIAWLITDPARTCELIAEWMEWMEGEHET